MLPLALFPTFPLAVRHPSRRRSGAARPGLLIALGLAVAWSTVAAAAVVSRDVRWTASPLKGPTGQALPPAVSYEVWLVVDAKPESLVATVPDTFWTLQARPGAVYAVRVRGVSAQGQKSAFSPWSDAWRVAVSPASATADGPALGQARPNPFNGRTAVAYTVPSGLPGGAELALGIYDVRGRHVRDLAVDRAPGSHEAVWDGSDAGGRPVAAGVYLARYVCGAYRATARLTLVA